MYQLDLIERNEVRTAGRPGLSNDDSLGGPMCPGTACLMLNLILLDVDRMDWDAMFEDRGRKLSLGPNDLQNSLTKGFLCEIRQVGRADALTTTIWVHRIGTVER